MFLSHWFESLGIDEILAPTNDDSPAAKPSDEESPIWQILAPRSDTRIPPTPRSDLTAGDLGDLVECVHCHRLTPVDGPRTETATAACPAPGVTRADPSSSSSDIHRRVLLACRGAARTSSCPQATHDQIYALFGLCLPSGNSSKAGVYDPKAPSKAIKKMIKQLRSQPQLLTARSGNMTNYFPDGFTLLHAACYGSPAGGNGEVVSFLLQEYLLKQEDRGSDRDRDRYDEALEVDMEMDMDRLDINDRDMQGRTALHLAAERGNVNILEMLRDAYQTLEQRPSQVTEHPKGLSNNRDMTPETHNSTAGSPVPPFRSPTPSFSGPNAPLDLANRTPLALASTSPVPKAKQNRKISEKLLYGKGGDRCLIGVERTPPQERCGGRRGMFSPVKGAKTPPPVNYLSPTPKKMQHPPLTSSTDYGTPFSSLPPTINEAVNDDKGLLWGASEKPGWRFEMEDAMCCHYPIPVPPLTSDCNTNHVIPSLGLFGVFDGHGDGGFASKYIATHILSKLSSHPQWPVAYHSIDSDTNSTTEGDGAMLHLLQESFHELDEDLKREASRVGGGGSTAIVAVVSEGKIFIANVGDSRCILVKKRGDAESKDAVTNNEWDSDTLEVIPLSEDHKPNLPSERARIESAGMSIHVDHIPPEEGDAGPMIIYKVKKSENDVLAVSRAFGDFDYKSNEALSPSRQAVICTPEIVVRKRHLNEDMYLVLACDGVFDVMNDEEVGLFVSSRLAERCANDLEGGVDLLAKVGDDLLDLCLKKGSRDNMSVLILTFPASGLGSMLGSSGGVSSEAVDGAKRLAF